MIDADRYSDFVKRTFSFLETEFNMMFGDFIKNGNVFYDVQYRDREKIISISLETIENYFQVILFKLDNGEMPDYDDKRKTIPLNKLNEDILKTLEKSEFSDNNEHFREFETKDKTEEIILKSARDLRLCLKHYDD
jgi:hypothetical protein